MDPIRVRKKPVVVEAMQLRSDDDLSEAERWIGEGCHIALDPNDTTVLVIDTLEGQMAASWEKQDWVIKGVHGEFYPCKADIFFATYEAASAVDAAIFEMSAGGEPPAPGSGLPGTDVHVQGDAPGTVASAANDADPSVDNRPSVDDIAGAVEAVMRGPLDHKQMEAIEEPVLAHEKLSDVIGHQPTETGAVGPSLDPSLVESQDEPREASEGERVSRTRTGPVGPSIVDTEAQFQREERHG